MKNKLKEKKMRNKIGNHMRIFAKLNIHILRDQNILNKTMDSIMDRILKHKQKNISFFSQIKKPLFLILSSAFLFSGCMVLRSHDSGYSSGSGKMQKTSSTINSTKGADDNDERFNVSQKTKLKQTENGLTTKKEIDQYSKSLPFFNTTQERLDFLSQPGFEARQRWLSEKKFYQRSNLVQSEMKDLVEAQDISVGMPQSLVRKSWGEPERIDVSGNPDFRNERWLYHRQISTPDGFKTEKKFVYFEGGKVIGWELE